MEPVQARTDKRAWRPRPPTPKEDGVKRLLVGVAGMVAVLASGSVPAVSGTTGALYNMEHMLRQPHPFSRPYVPPPEPRQPRRQPLPATTPLPPAPRTAPVARPLPAAPVATPARRPSPLQEADSGWTGEFEDFFSEVRLGALWHDQGPFSSNKEDGVDINLEVLFTSPDVLDVIWSPRPHIGISYNTAGDTSQIYLGLTYEWDFWEDYFAGFSIAGAVHDGKIRTEELDRKELGCRFLFRESITFGYRFDRHHAVMAHMDHISNAKLCSTNEGLESLGVRYGYRF
jgi:lipid A 3-O-deacylase